MVSESQPTHESYTVRRESTLRIDVERGIKNLYDIVTQHFQEDSMPFHPEMMAKCGEFVVNEKSVCVSSEPALCSEFPAEILHGPGSVIINIGYERVCEDKIEMFSKECGYELFISHLKEQMRKWKQEADRTYESRLRIV